MLLRDLFESPISDFHHIGNFDKPSSFRHAQDRKLVTAPKALEKIRGMWKYPEETMFNVIFINHPDIAGKQPTATHSGPLQEVGIVDVDWLEDNMPRVWPELQPMLNHDQVNVIYTNNSGSERVPMTGWIMAHRLGHGLYADQRMAGWGKEGSAETYYMGMAFKEVERALHEVMSRYGIGYPDHGFYGARKFIPQNGALLGFIRNFCTFRSARDSNVRNPFEIVYECMAQYMMTGRIRFNDIPKGYRYGNSYYRFRGDEGDYHQFNARMKDELANDLQDFFTTTLQYCEGKIIVM